MLLCSTAKKLVYQINMEITKWTMFVSCISRVQYCFKSILYYITLYHCWSVVYYLPSGPEAKCTILVHVSVSVPVDGDPMLHIIRSHDLI